MEFFFVAISSTFLQLHISCWTTIFMSIVAMCRLRFNWIGARGKNRFLSIGHFHAKQRGRKYSCNHSGSATPDPARSNLNQRRRIALAKIADLVLKFYTVHNGNRPSDDSKQRLALLTRAISYLPYCRYDELWRSFFLRFFPLSFNAPMLSFSYFSYYFLLERNTHSIPSRLLFVREIKFNYYWRARTIFPLAWQD